MMTKQEFDLLFPIGKCLVAASNMNEYLKAHDYAVEEYAAIPSNSRDWHDCQGYPYVFVRPDTHMVDATFDSSRGPIIPFVEWEEIVSDADGGTELCAANLSDIL